MTLSESVVLRIGANRIHEKQISDFKRGIAKISPITLSPDLKTGEIGTWPMGTRATVVDRVIDGQSMIVHAEKA